MKIIGIDPGLSGAIAILENNKVLKNFKIGLLTENNKTTIENSIIELAKRKKNSLF